MTGEKFKMGAGTSSLDWAELERRVGKPLEARRSYRAGMFTTKGLDSIEAGDVAAGRLTVTSWQPTSYSQTLAVINRDAGMKSMLQGWWWSFPTDADVVGITGHEPTNPTKWRSGGVYPDAGTYLAMVDVLCDWIAEVNNGDADHPRREKRIRPWGCHIPWHARTGVVNAFMSDRWRGCAWDGYDWDGVCPDPASIYGTAYALTESLGQRVAIGEFGSDKVNQDTGKANTGRAAWIGEVRQHAAEHNAAFVLYWDNSNWLLSSDAEFKALAP